MVLIACEKEKNSPPLADIGVFPNIADTSSYIRFNGSSSNDLETPVELLQFRWDFNGDGVWETEYRRDPVAIWQFEKTGTYQPVMEVRDEGGLASTDSIEVIIRLNFLRSSFTDPRDGTSYKTVLIDGTWWMAENLRYGVVINPDTIPSDNAITEIYKLDSSEMGKNYIGGYYTWGEITNYQRDIEGEIWKPEWGADMNFNRLAFNVRCIKKSE